MVFWGVLGFSPFPSCACSYCPASYAKFGMALLPAVRERRARVAEWNCYSCELESTNEIMACSGPKDLAAERGWSKRGLGENRPDGETVAMPEQDYPTPKQAEDMDARIHGRGDTPAASVDLARNVDQE